MRKKVAQVAWGVLLAVIVLFTLSARAGIFWISREYYTDAAMTNNVGWWERDCSNFETQWGLQHAEYRRINWDPCNPDAWGTTDCHRYVNGTWVRIDCPF